MDNDRKYFRKKNRYNSSYRKDPKLWCARVVYCSYPSTPPISLYHVVSYHVIVLSSYHARVTYMCSTALSDDVCLTCYNSIDNWLFSARCCSRYFSCSTWRGSSGAASDRATHRWFSSLNIRINGGDGVVLNAAGIYLSTSYIFILCIMYSALYISYYHLWRENNCKSKQPQL